MEWLPPESFPGGVKYGSVCGRAKILCSGREVQVIVDNIKWMHGIIFTPLDILKTVVEMIVAGGKT